VQSTDAEAMRAREVGVELMRKRFPDAIVNPILAGLRLAGDPHHTESRHQPGGWSRADVGQLIPLSTKALRRPPLRRRQAPLHDHEDEPMSSITTGEHAGRDERRRHTLASCSMRQTLAPSGLFVSTAAAPSASSSARRHGCRTP